MPELPEVETIKRVLEKWCVGKKVSKFYLFYDKLLENTNVNELNNLLVNQEIIEVRRRGKFILFIFKNDYVLISHLRMEGKWHYGFFSDNKLEEGITFDLKAKEEGNGHKHAHFLMEFSDGHLLIYEDFRKFGRIILDNVSKMSNHNPLNKLGLEPFDDNLTANYLINKFKKLNINIKQALLDQSIISGLGNIYVDEVLFLSGLLPTVKVKDIGDDLLSKLIENSKIVLTKAIELGGSTVSTYHFANDVDGKFQNELNVYGRQNEKCFKCDATIQKIFVQGRGTSFCPRCQKGLIKNAVIGVTGTIGAGKSFVSSLISQYGYKVLDADKITKNGQEINQELYNKIIKVFKDYLILNEDKTINRSQLRKIILDNEKLKIKLEEIVHPFVYRHILEEIVFNVGDKFVLDIPILFKSKINELCNLTILVTCDDEVRIKRLSKRNNMPIDEALKLGNSINHLNNHYDFTIDNSFNEENVKKELKDLFEIINK